MQGISLITAKLESAEIRYCIVGGLAAIVYGRPRMTLDLDLVMALTPAQARVLPGIFPPEDFYLPPEETLLTEIQRESRGHFNIIHQHSALRADCYLPGKIPLAIWELSHRRKHSVGAIDGWFAPPEAVIVSKLQFFREGQSSKHLDDIRSMIDAGSVQTHSDLLRWIEELGLQKEWAQVSGSETD